VKIVQFMASPKYVGAERSFVELSNELAKEDEVVALVVRGCEYKDKFSDAVKVVELRSNPSRLNPLLYIEIAKILRQERPDIVHAHSAKAAQIMERLWRVMGFSFVATKRNSKKSSVFHRIPHVVGVSKEAVKGIEGAKVIYNAITPKKLPNIQKEPIFTIVAIGALRAVKGFDELIEAAAKLPFDFRLWIVGEGEERGRLEKLIEELGVEKRVKLLGWRDDTHILQARAHLQVINSHREGFSRALIEGLFYSDVVISKPVGGSVEILPPDFIYDDPAQKIQEVYENYEDYKRRFARLKAELAPKFHLSQTARRYRELYKEVAG